MPDFPQPCGPHGLHFKSLGVRCPNGNVAGPVARPELSRRIDPKAKHGRLVDGVLFHRLPKGPKDFAAAVSGHGGRPQGVHAVKSRSMLENGFPVSVVFLPRCHHSVSSGGEPCVRVGMPNEVVDGSLMTPPKTGGFERVHVPKSTLLTLDFAL